MDENNEKYENECKSFLKFVKKKTNFLWSSVNSSGNISIKNDNLTICKESDTNSSDLARGHEGFTSGVHIFEINSPPHKRGDVCIIGFSTINSKNSAPGNDSQLMGKDQDSFGWDLNENKALWNINNEKSYPNDVHNFKAPSLFYMVLDLNKGILNFRSFSQDYHSCCICLKRIFGGRQLYPTINLSTKDSEITMVEVYNENNNSKIDKKFGNISKYTNDWNNLNKLMSKKTLKYTNFIREALKDYIEILSISNDNDTCLMISMYTYLMIHYDETQTLNNYFTYLIKRSGETNLTNPIDNLLNLFIKCSYSSRQFSTYLVKHGCLGSLLDLLKNIKNKNEKVTYLL